MVNNIPLWAGKNAYNIYVRFRLTKVPMKNKPSITRNVNLAEMRKGGFRWKEHKN